MPPEETSVTTERAGTETLSLPVSPLYFRLDDSDVSYTRYFSASPSSRKFYPRFPRLTTTTTSRPSPR